MNIDNQTLQNSKNFNAETFGGQSAFRSGIGYSISSENEGGGGASVLQTPGGSFKSELDKILMAETLETSEFDIDEILKDLDIGETVSLESVNIQRDDAIFYINLLNEGGMLNYTVQNDGNIIDAANYKSIEVSKTLSSLLLHANETKKAVRLDFDNNVTVILKFSNEGKINAHFIPGDKAVEEYLKNNIPYLKQRFEEQNIPYVNLSYKQHRQRENGQQNKEKNNE